MITYSFLNLIKTMLVDCVLGHSIYIMKQEIFTQTG